MTFRRTAVGAFTPAQPPASVESAPPQRRSATTCSKLANPSRLSRTFCALPKLPRRSGRTAMRWTS